MLVTQYHTTPRRCHDVGFLLDEILALMAMSLLRSATFWAPLFHIIQRPRDTLVDAYFTPANIYISAGQYIRAKSIIYHQDAISLLPPGRWQKGGFIFTHDVGLHAGHASDDDADDVFAVYYYRKVDCAYVLFAIMLRGVATLMDVDALDIWPYHYRHDIRLLSLPHLFHQMSYCNA